MAVAFGWDMAMAAALFSQLEAPLQLIEMLWGRTTAARTLYSKDSNCQGKSHDSRQFSEKIFGGIPALFTG